MIETKRLQIVSAAEADIDHIIALESHPDNRNFVWIGTREEHTAEIKDDAHLLLVFKAKEDGRTIGYSLNHLNFKSHVFELRRIVIDDKGKGYGEECLKALIRYAFEERDTNRFWLDVYPDNAVGIALYEKMGMHKDGMLRQSYLSERGYLNQIVYSLLKSEYQARKDFYAE